MREILFRGKRKDNGEWVYGAYSKYDCDYDIPTDTFEMVEKHTIIDYNDECSWCDVIPETVGQDTGLTDKNGQKIFEGDIVFYARDEENGQIEYHEREAMFVVEFEDWLTDFDHLYGNDLEVIGNIHDNPEQLGGKEEQC